MRFVLAVLALLPAASAAMIIWLAWNNPRRLLEINREVRRPDEELEDDPRVRDYLVLILALLGLGMFIYSGIHSCLFWMPGRWGAVGESGDWQPYRESVSALASVLAFPLFNFIVGTARLRMREVCRTGEGA